jgi:REP element-mobilizing transposase RayT
MTQPRNRLVSLGDTPYYHCVTRCVRRAFLCGKDPSTGADCNHRRQWVVDRMNELVRIFAIDVCSYSVMSNHYHIVIRVDPGKAQQWSEKAVVSRWLNIYSGPDIVKQWLSERHLAEEELALVHETTAIWRKRLYDLSWFMRCLNESIARHANEEDDCTGRFWEGRFHSQALLDERALLTCMAYVDLNPLRAGMAETPEQSDYTSIQERIRHPWKSRLLPFTGLCSENSGVPFELKDYLEFVDWAGRSMRPRTRGAMAGHTPPILSRLWTDAAPVLDFLKHEQRSHVTALGSAARMRILAERKDKKFIKGLSLGRQICPEPD